MTAGGKISVLLTDIGGVLLSNGWDADARHRAAGLFGLDAEEMDARHHLTFDTYEVGKISLETYLNRVVFYEPRVFPMDNFRQFMLAQSQPLPDMIAFVRRLAQKNGLRVGAVSNEGRELTEHRLRTFGLTEFIQFFISSCFVHLRKPDEDIFRLALDVAQAAPDAAAYLDDRAMFVEVARGLGIHSIHHTSLATTRRAMADLGLAVE
jgi:putative hydrolase of the HAD superfamily